MHVPELAMPPCAERLEDGAVKDVGADGSLRVEPEDEDQHRRHQRPAAHAGHADQCPDRKAGDHELPVHSDASPTMPAPTVSFVASSTSTNAPVARFWAYRSTASGSASRKRTTPRSFSSSFPGDGL